MFRFLDFRSFALEQLLRQLVEGVVCVTVVLDDDGLLDELRKGQLGDHIILREYPVAVVEAFELLVDAEVLHPVDRCLLGQCELTAAHMIGGVLEDVDVATESEVHLVVGQEVEMDTRVALDLHRVFDVETVEGDGVLADR